MNPFKRASSAASLHADCAKLRRRLTDLEAQRATLQQTISTSTEAVHQALMSEAAESVVVKAEEALTSAERRLTAVTATIAAIEREVAAKELEITVAARRKAAEEAVAALKADDARVVDLMHELADIAAKLLPVATRHARGNWDALEIEAIAKMMAEELPRLAARVSATTDFECSRLLSGTTSPKKAIPEVVLPPKSEPIPTQQMFSLDRIRWSTGCAHRNQYCSIPVELVERATDLGWIISPDDARVSDLYRRAGQQLAPSLADAMRDGFTDISSPELKKRSGLSVRDELIKNHIQPVIRSA